MMITPVLLCGGSGTRLWPISRKSYPKQFVPLTGEKSLFTASAERLSRDSISASINRMSSWSGQRSANSLSARRSSSRCPAFCIRSAYSRKFLRASLRKPLLAEILPNL